jgi:hypothetical protein
VVVAHPIGNSARSSSVRLRITAAAGLAALASFGAVVAFGGIRDSPPAAGASPDAGALTFVRGVARMIAENRYADAWPLLYPAHRDAARLAEFVACERRSPVPGRLVAVHLGTAFGEKTRVGPTSLVASRAVPVQVVLRDPATSRRTVVRDVVHAVRAGGRWTWILSPERLAAYRVDRCPAAPPAAR